MFFTVQKTRICSGLVVYNKILMKKKVGDKDSNFYESVRLN